MEVGFNLDWLLDALAERVATKIAERQEGGPVRPRLLTVEQAAVYLGRTKEAFQHLNRERQNTYRPLRPARFP